MPEAVLRLPRRVSGFRALAGRRSQGPRMFRVGAGRAGVMEPDLAGIQSRAEPSPSPSAFPRHALLLSLCFSETRSPRTRVARDGFELAIFLHVASAAVTDTHRHVRLMRCWELNPTQLFYFSARITAQGDRVGAEPVTS